MTRLKEPDFTLAINDSYNRHLAVHDGDVEALAKDYFRKYLKRSDQLGRSEDRIDLLEKAVLEYAEHSYRRWSASVLEATPWRELSRAEQLHQAGRFSGVKL